MEVDSHNNAASSAQETMPPPLPTHDPAALEGALRAAVGGQGDYARALAAAEAAELLIQTGRWPPAGGAGPGAVLAAQLLLLLVARDLDNARFLWRRSDAGFKAAGSPLSEAWALGKLLWTRDTPAAYARMDQWAAAGGGDLLPPLVKALRARVAADELALCSRAYKRITAPALAPKLGLPSPAEALEVARRAGWRVLDENKGELEPVPSAVATQAPGAEDAVGLPQLAQLARYVAFLERKSVTALAPNSA